MSPRLKPNSILTDGNARACEFTTRRGTVVRTPNFMPVATVGAFRGIRIEDIAPLNYPIILNNTFHLFLRPGGEIIENQGGIQKMMNWGGSVLTDSGGFQMFSLSKSFRLTEDGAHVRSYVDGKWHLFSPELSIKTQHQIGADILMVLDHCVASTSSKEIAREAVMLSHRWGKRSFAAHGDHTSALFGIVQGACDEELRKVSAELTCETDFDGIALGGLAVGEEKSQREDITEFTTKLLPDDKIRYLMGVGTPIDLLEAVNRGVDIFDCIIPTAYGQQGEVFTSQGKLSLRRGVYKNDSGPIDPSCPCVTCQKYSRAYLHHLIKSKEVVGQSLCGIHNLTFYKLLCNRMRSEIVNGSFSYYYKEAREQLILLDGNFPTHPPKLPRKRSKVLGDYEIIEEEGVNYILQKSSGEVMHPAENPIKEARELYLELSGLETKLKELLASDEPTLTIWDVGLGAAYNAMTVIAKIQELDVENKLKVTIYSFENDTDSLRLAMRHKMMFPHLWHKAPETLISEGSWKSDSGNIAWTLVSGDVEQTMEEVPQGDFVLFDLYSPRTLGKFWEVDFLSKLYSRIKTGGTFITYSQATPVRAALLAANFFVGIVPGVPPKETHTIAWKENVPESSKSILLTKDFLTKWRASHKKYPTGTTDFSEFDQMIEGHEQWGG